MKILIFEMGCDTNFIVKIYDTSKYDLEKLYDKEALCDIYGEYFVIHRFRQTGCCLVSAYKATVEDISNVLIEYLDLDSEDFEIREIDINDL